MPDSFYDPNDATQPSYPPQYNNQPAPPYSNQNQQNNGGARNPQNPRQPYQYPGAPGAQQPPQQRPPGAPIPGNERYPYQQPQPGYPYQPGNARNPQQGSPFVNPPQRASNGPRRRRGCLPGCLIALIIIVLIGAFAFNATQRVLAFGSKISTQTPLSTSNGYMNTSARTNLLVMGYGGGTHDGAYLTDSLVVVSLLPQSHHTSLVSVPRDLLVQYPPNSGQYTKINAIYEFASSNNKDPKAGGASITQKVSLVTGMNVTSWLTIDFDGFKKVIDAIGGVDVPVPDSFNACYPKNDDAAVDPSWIKVQFNKGIQHMDGATAIEYARAREPLSICGMGQSENLAELTDFGRSARQQIIIKAVLSQIKQISTWPRLYSALDALQQTIQTNMSLADLASFALKMDLNDPKSARVGLSNQNVLRDSPPGGTYYLQPADGNWAAIPPYIQQHLYN